MQRRVGTKLKETQLNPRGFWNDQNIGIIEKNKRNKKVINLIPFNESKQTR